MVNIFKKSISFIVKKLQKYVENDKNKNADKDEDVNKDDFKEKNISTNQNTSNNNYLNQQNQNFTSTTIKSKENTQTQMQDQKNQVMQNEYTRQEPKINDVQILKNNINTVWDIIKIKENTQAQHLIQTIPSDRWVDMEEIKQRIKLDFNIEYKNEKSLYPYLKTLTDINLIKLNNTGRKRSWKKNIIIVDIIK